MIVSELTGAGKPFPGSNPAPWDLVRDPRAPATWALSSVYDDRTWPDADRVAAAVRTGIGDVRSAMPFGWDGRAVVYVFAPAGGAEQLRGRARRQHQAPRCDDLPDVRRARAARRRRHRGSRCCRARCDAGQAFLDRIVRHELTHVALGERDDGVPIWFAEGIAEYLGARADPAGPAPDRLRRGDARHARACTPCRRRAGFNGADQAWHYALAWMACDYIAATRGEALLWQLMDAFHAGGARHARRPAGRRAPAGDRDGRCPAGPPGGGAHRADLRVTEGATAALVVGGRAASPTEGRGRTERVETGEPTARVDRRGQGDLGHIVGRLDVLDH